MNKAIFVFLCLLGLALTITINHQDDAPAPDTTTAPVTTTEIPTTPVGPQVQPQPDPETQAAYGRFFQFIMKDNSLRETFQNQGQPNELQIKKIIGFMIRDEFFRKGLLKQISSSEGNEWVASLSEQAQLRFLKIITSVSPSKLENPKLQAQIAKKLLKDPEIGPALKSKFGDNVEEEFFKSISSTLSKNPVGGAAHFMALFD